MSETPLPVLVRQFLEQHQLITTLADAQAWCIGAQEVVTFLETGRKVLDNLIEDQVVQLSNLRSKAKQENALGWLFRSKEEKGKAKQMASVTANRDDLLFAIDSIQQKLRLTPNSAEQRGQFLNGLRITLKELQLEKRSVSAAIRDIRADARRKSANAPYSIVTPLVGSVAERRKQVRLVKEVQIGPLEKKRADLEAQIIHNQKQVLWLEALH